MGNLSCLPVAWAAHWGESVKALVVRRASRCYGTRRRVSIALDGCSFESELGEVIGVVGPNGAGKTTLLRVIAGEIPLSSGSVSIGGLRAGTRPARRSVGYAAEPPMAPPELTGFEWLKFLASHRSSDPSERIALVRWAVELGELESFAGRRIADYSRGMVQRLALAAAGMTGRTAVLLDEVLSGIDPLVSSRLRGRVVDLAASGRVVVIASHDLATVEKLATRVLVLWDGHLTADVDVSRLVTERVAELALNGSAIARVDGLIQRFPGTVRTGEGVAIPLKRGLTVEQVMTACRNARVAVAGSRVRYRALEDILHAAAARHRGGM